MACETSPEHFKSPVVESEQGAYAHVVDASFEGPVHGVQPPQVVALLGVVRVVLCVGLLVVCLLEYLEGTYAGGLYDFVTLYVQRCRIDVDPSDLPVAGLGAVGQIYCVGDEFRGIFGMFSVYEDKSLVPFVLQGFYLLHELFIGERMADSGTERAAESAVLAVIGTVVAYVQRCEKYNAVAVY